MASFQLLYDQSPHLAWLALACLFVGLSLASGAGLFMGPAAAAAVLAVTTAAGVRPSPIVQLALFAALSVVIVGGWAVRARRAARQARRIKAAPQGKPVADPPQDTTGRLIGRIGEASSDFANGVGRVWIDQAEWAAELDEGEEVSAGEPVRVVKVIGGVRLQVHPLAFG